MITSQELSWLGHYHREVLTYSSANAITTVVVFGIDDEVDTLRWLRHGESSEVTSPGYSHACGYVN